MTTRFDDDPEFGPDDPLAVILRPPSGHLGPPSGRYEAIRRAATRRRLIRAVTGAGLSCAVAALIALQLHPAAPGSPASPAVPPVPPPVSGRTTSPGPSASPSPAAAATPGTARSTRRQGTGGTRAPSRSAVPTPEPSTEPSRARVVPSTDGTASVAVPESRP
ncbi:hypothetical protein [Streptomyces sp. NPDC058964]|uniref:hypothetical protein n=1 Tax=Streptomyces sp. NPDC058964 TaxID=3346681 RepID=UPI0036783F5D